MAPSSGGILDSVGRTLLDTIDFRVWSLASILILLLLAWLNRRKHGAWPEMTAWMLAAAGSLMIYSGFTVFCVFILTRPAYVEALSPDTFALTALLSSIAMCFLGWREVVKLWKVPARPSADPAPSKASEQAPPSSPESSGSKSASK